MTIASSYIPIDRRWASATGEDLPERMSGAALFVDISGFTPLTEALVLELGHRRGAEELTRQINAVYDALISTLYRFGGSVISFSGDSVTCWLRDDDGRRAVACGLAMQATMAQFAEVRTVSGRIISLGVKVAAAVGPVRRFVVGQGNAAETMLIDTMAGVTLSHMVQAEAVARRGEVVVHETAVTLLQPHLDIAEWRSDHFAVVTGLRLDVAETPWQDLPNPLSDDQIQKWLLPSVYQRLQGGQGEFLAELRPVVAMFCRFTGLDYDADEQAPAHLDAFMTQTQRVLHRLGGSLLQLTIGDKGSYFYAAFGAPTAHEDDAVRAAAAALEFQRMFSGFDFLETMQIGISLGRMRVGAYGSSVRRTYGAIGDAVNLAARLMMFAAAGEIIVSDNVREAAGNLFQWESRAATKVKGKGTAVAIYRLVSQKQAQQMHLLEPSYRLPMVGRMAELTLLNEKLDMAHFGNGQIVGITAEAGMGKSRLAAEVIRLAAGQGFTLYGGECQSFGTNSSYMVWQGVFRDFFGLDGNLSTAAQIEQVTAVLGEIDAALLPRLPLLGPVLNLTIPDNDLTAPLDAKIRKSSLESLLVTCLQARARLQPLLLVLEDIHWLDPLSFDLIGVLARAIQFDPILLLLVYRPPDRQREQMPKVDHLPYFMEIEVADFTEAEADRLIQLKLQQFFGKDTAVPDTFRAAITSRAAGNPFYIEEILNYISDLGVNPADDAQMAQIDLPDSIHSLILSRIDQLDERQQITIRVASVIGRLFPAAMVWGVYPELGESQVVRQDLDMLSDLELTPLDSPEPELTYLFKHVMTQQVAYESLPFATRARLHGEIGAYIEQTHADKLDRFLDLLAFHYSRSENEAKRRVYLLRAGEAAQAKYANAAALDYLQRGLALLPAAEQVPVLMRLGEVLELVGRWTMAHEHYQQAMHQADIDRDAVSKARAQLAIGELQRKTGKYAEAASWYAQARMVDDAAVAAKALICAGTLAAQQGNFDEANRLYDDSLAIRRRLNDQRNAANVLNNMAIVARLQGDYQRSRMLHEEALAIRRELGDRWAIATSLNNLGNVLTDLEELAAARRYLDEAVAIQREIGDKWYTANALNNLGNVARDQGDLKQAAVLYAESLTINRELDDKWALAYLLEDVAVLAGQQGAAERALRLAGAAAAVRQTINSPLSAVEQGKLDRRLTAARAMRGESAALADFQLGQAMVLETAVSEALAGL